MLDNTYPSRASRAAVIQAAADHGVHAQGVTQWPQVIKPEKAKSCLALRCFPANRRSSTFWTAVREVAPELSGLDEATLARLLDPRTQTGT